MAKQDVVVHRDTKAVAELTGSATTSNLELQLTKDDVVDMFVNERQLEFQDAIQVLVDKSTVKLAEIQAVTDETAAIAEREVRKQHRGMVAAVEGELGHKLFWQPMMDSYNKVAYGGQLISNDPNSPQRPRQVNTSPELRGNVIITLVGEVKYDLFTTHIQKIKDINKEIVEINKEIQAVNKEAGKLGQLSQRAKASIVRSIMGSTENGKKLLSAITNATSK